MPKNEDGEFELILGNRQLLSVFFIVVILLGVFFTMGYIVGHNSAPLIAETAAPAEGGRPPAGEAPVPAAVAPKEDPAPAPAGTAAQLPAGEKPAPLPAPASTAEVPKAEPAKPPAAAPSKPTASAAGQPAAGATYLQLAATSKHEADVMVDVLRQKGFKSMAAEIAEKAGTFRVLVGPVTDATINLTRAELQKTGFPGSAAIRRTF